MPIYPVPTLKTRIFRVAVPPPLLKLKRFFLLLLYTEVLCLTTGATYILYMHAL